MKKLDEKSLFDKQIEFLAKLNHVKILDVDKQRKTVTLNVRGNEYVATSRNNDLKDVTMVLSWIDNFNLKEINYDYFRVLLTYVKNVDTLFYQGLILETKNLNREVLDIFLEACEYTQMYKIINTELTQTLQAHIDAINPRAN